MFTISKATSEDFERIYPLLQGFGNSAISKDTWRKIFVTPWKTEENFCGYQLLENGDVKGYLGLIFSRRVFNDTTEQLCNMTSWIVADDCRSQSLSLLLELLKMKDYTLTNFTASPTVQAIVSRLGFREFSVDQRVLLPVPALAVRRTAVGCEFDLQSIRGKLNGEDLRIFDDHHDLNCRHLLLQSASGDCYLVLKNTRRKKLTFAKIHYLGNAAVFNSCIESLVARICFRLSVFGLMVDERYIGGRQFRGSVKYPHQRKAYFKSNSIIDSNQLDTAYSELVILHD